MSRKKRNSRNDIIIDLTSLLDVIFIILIVVMVDQKIEGDKIPQEHDDFHTAKAEYENATELYQDLIDTEKNIDKYFWSVSIIVPIEPNEIHKRTIWLKSVDGEDEKFELIGSEVDDALKEFKESLERSIRKHSDKPVLLSLNENDEKILYRDEKAIKKILDELSRNYKNVFIKGNLSEVEQ